MSLFRIVAVGLLALVPGLLGGTRASAQILQVADDGKVAVLAGPTVTTAAGTEAIEAKTIAAVGRAQPMAGPAGTLAEVFAGASRESGVDARLLHAVAWHESRFRQDVVSNKGAIGVMQLMPETARWLGVDPRDVIQNIRGGAALLGRLLRQYDGNLDLTLAAYSAGPGAVHRYGGVPPFTETRNYVADIRRALSF